MGLEKLLLVDEGAHEKRDQHKHEHRGHHLRVADAHHTLPKQHQDPRGEERSGASAARQAAARPRRNAAGCCAGCHPLRGTPPATVRPAAREPRGPRGPRLRTRGGGGAHLLQKDAAKEAGCARDALAVGRQRPGTPRGLSWGRVGGRHPRAPSRMRPPCATVASAARVTSTPGVFVGACHDEAPRHGRTENRRVGMVAAHRPPDEEVRGVVMTEGAWADL